MNEIKLWDQCVFWDICNIWETFCLPWFNNTLKMSTIFFKYWNATINFCRKIPEALSPLNSVLGGMLQSSISCFKKTSQWILMFSSKQLFSPRTGHCMITSLGLKRGVIVVQKIRFLWGVRAFFLERNPKRPFDFERYYRKSNISYLFTLSPVFQIGSIL